MQSYHKRKCIYDFLRKFKIDVAFLQETHSDASSNDRWMTEWGGKWPCSHGTTCAWGVSILLNPKLKYNKISNLVKDNEGRLIMCELQYDNQNFLLCNLYNYNTDDPGIIKLIQENMQGFTAENIIIGGDFNFVMNDDLDAKNQCTSHNSTRMVLSQLIDNNDLVDIWRIKNPDTFSFTWHRMK